MERRRLVTGALAGAGLGLGLPSAAMHAQERTSLRVFRDPGCECCRGWVRHMVEAGFDVRLEERPRTDPLRRAAGVPVALMGCHTALHDRFVFEGHVPATAVRRFLADPGPWRGLAVPGMPVGSPGMEVDGMAPEPYEIVRYDAAGRRERFATAKGSVLLQP